MTGETPFRSAARGGLLRRVMGTALAQLTMARILETVREPGTMFWVFGFPILLSVGLGLAFRNRTPEPPFVGVLDGEAATATAGRRQRRGGRDRGHACRRRTCTSSAWRRGRRPSGCVRARSRCW